MGDNCVAFFRKDARMESIVLFVHVQHCECSFAGKFQTFCSNSIVWTPFFRKRHSQPLWRRRPIESLFCTFFTYLCKCWQLIRSLKNNKKWDITWLEHRLVIVVESSRIVGKLQINTPVLEERENGSSWIKTAKGRQQMWKMVGKSSLWLYFDQLIKNGSFRKDERQHLSFNSPAGKVAHEPWRPTRPEVNPVFCSMKQLRVLLLPPDGMLVHPEGHSL